MHHHSTTSPPSAAALAFSWGRSRHNEVVTRRARHFGSLVAVCLVLPSSSARPEFDQQLELAVVGSHFEHFASRAQRALDDEPEVERPEGHLGSDGNAARGSGSSVPPPKEETLPDSEAAACESHFLTPSNWGLSIHLGHEAKNGVVEEAAEEMSAREKADDKKAGRLKIIEVARAFRGFPPIVENLGNGIFLRPAVDAWTPHWIFTKFGCKFEGEVRLGLTENCQDAESSTAYAVRGESSAFRLISPRRLLVAAKSRRQQANGTELPMLHQAADLQLYFCVKPAKHWEWHPMTLLWYFRDADGKSALALNPDDNRIPHLRGWEWSSRLPFSEPLAEELVVPKCSEKRWGDFEKLDHELGGHSQAANAQESELAQVNAGKMKELEKVASEAVAGTPCNGKGHATKNMPPHSAIVFQLSHTGPRAQGPATKAVALAKSSTEHPVTPGSKAAKNA